MFSILFIKIFIYLLLNCNFLLFFTSFNFLFFTGCFLYGATTIIRCFSRGFLDKAKSSFSTPCTFIIFHINRSLNVNYNLHCNRNILVALSTCKPRESFTSNRDMSISVEIKFVSGTPHEAGTSVRPLRTFAL